MVLIIALVAVIALSASSCSDGPDIQEAPPAPVLASGEYRLTVVEARALDCQGAGAEDFVGQQAWGYLDSSRAEPEGPVVFELEGIPLDGTMVPGALSVGGSLLVGQDEPHSTEPDDDVDYADTGADPSRGGGSSGSGGGSAGHGDPDEPPAYEAWATLEANIQEGNHAMGVLVVSSPGCAYELNVSMDLASPEDGVDTGYVGVPEDTGAVYAEEGDDVDG